MLLVSAVVGGLVGLLIGSLLPVFSPTGREFKLRGRNCPCVLPRVLLPHLASQQLFMASGMPVTVTCTVVGEPDWTDLCLQRSMNRRMAASYAGGGGILLSGSTTCFSESSAARQCLSIVAPVPLVVSNTSLVSRLGPFGKAETRKQSALEPVRKCRNFGVGAAP